jgi:diguanylate cyclase (GGDEF)-like protein/PAS domain S-box-containing protein
MPDIDGFELAEILRSRKETENVPIIFITGSDISKKLEFSGFQKGAVDFLYKPIKPAPLIGKVKWLMALQQESLKLHHALTKLETLSHQNELLLECAAQGIFGIDNEGVIVTANPAAEKFLAGNNSDFIGTHIGTYLKKINSDTTLDWCKLKALIFSDAKTSYRTDGAWFEGKNNKTFPAEINCGGIVDEGQERAGIVLMFEDITARHELEQKLIHRARYDALTKLANRHLLIEIGDSSVETAKKTNTRIAMIFIDLDGFKNVNDTLGHEAGDLLLIAVSDELKNAVGSKNLVARLGGDEFAIMISDVTTPESIIPIANKIISSISEIKTISDMIVSVSASVGIAMYPEAGDNFAELLKSADVAMYKSKNSGKNRFSFFSAEIQERASKELEILAKLENINDDNFAILYQPVVDSETGDMTAVESLLKINLDDNASIDAKKFIEGIDDQDKLIKISKWQIDSIINDIEHLIDKIGTLDLTFSINLSLNQLSNVGVVSYLIGALTPIKLQKIKFSIEMPAGTKISGNEQAVDHINSLQEHGFEIILDHFNLGVNVIDNIISINIDSIKISRDLIEGIGNGEKVEGVIKSIICLSKEFNIEVVAVGVNSSEKIEFLKKCDCRYMQGHAYSKAISRNELCKSIHLKY